MEIFHLFFIRNIYGSSLILKTLRGTKVVWSVVIAVTAAQFAITYLPSLQSVFASAAIPFWDGVMIVCRCHTFCNYWVEKQVRLVCRRLKVG